jgi:hypothetical protein
MLLHALLWRSLAMQVFQWPIWLHIQMSPAQLILAPHGRLLVCF